MTKLSENTVKTALVCGVPGGFGPVLAGTGDHLKLAKNAPVHSPSRAVARLMEKDTRISTLTPEKVSLAIYDIIQTRSRKLRSPMDRAKRVGLIKRIPPKPSSTSSSKACCVTHKKHEQPLAKGSSHETTHHRFNAHCPSHVRHCARNIGARQRDRNMGHCQWECDDRYF